MNNVLLVLALIGGPFVVAEVREHFIRAEIAQGQRVRCVRSETGREVWERGE